MGMPAAGHGGALAPPCVMDISVALLWTTSMEQSLDCYQCSTKETGLQETRGDHLI